MNVQSIALEATQKVLAEAIVRFAKIEKGAEVAPHLVKIIIGAKCDNPNYDPNVVINENPDFNPEIEISEENPPYFQTAENPAFDANLPASEENVQHVKIPLAQNHNPEKDYNNTLPFFKLVKNDQPFMRKNKQGVLTDEVTMNAILDVKLFDPMQRETLANAFLSKAIARFAKQQETAPTEIEIMIVLVENTTTHPAAFLYDWSKETPLIKQLHWENDIFIKDEEINKAVLGN